MNSLLASAFDEGRVYRIDHYLAKDTVRNLLVLRFANTIFEPLWNRGHVDHVQITAAETIGVEGRGGTYEQIGVVRDVIQNHVMQLLALAAMEPPAGGDPEQVRDRKVEIFRSLDPVGPDDFVFGQYRGYRDERNVAEGSRTPTFAAVKMAVDNERWRGVPFYIRAGKRLARSVVEVVVRFREVPLDIFEVGAAYANQKPNSLIARIQPDEGVRLSFSTRGAGREEEVVPANLDFRYADIGGALSGGYERVLLDGLEGKPSLFWRSDGIEAAWRAVEPLLEAEGTPPAYGSGSWGPVQAAELLRRDGRAWTEPY
jgi:glucose-6-phosphate 1-dehydrogenase